MREFTKSAVSAGLAGSLFGVRQVVNAFAPAAQGEPNKATEAFNAVAHAMADQCGESLRETFHSVDKLQRELVDRSTRLLSPGQAPPDGTAGSWTGMVSQATEQMGQWFSSVTAGGCGCGSSDNADTGWGPVPPPEHDQ